MFDAFVHPFVDLFAFSIGFYIIWGVATGVRYSVDYIRARRASVLLSQIWKWCTIVVKSSALLSIWVSNNFKAKLPSHLCYSFYILFIH